MQGGGEKVVRNSQPSNLVILPETREPVLRAILTDSHFWIPFAVLGIGIALLLHLV